MNNVNNNVNGEVTMRDVALVTALNKDLPIRMLLEGEGKWNCDKGAYDDLSVVLQHKNILFETNEVDGRRYLTIRVEPCDAVRSVS